MYNNHFVNTKLLNIRLFYRLFYTLEIAITEYIIYLT